MCSPNAPQDRQSPSSVQGGVREFIRLYAVHYAKFDPRRRSPTLRDYVCVQSGFSEREGPSVLRVVCWVVTYGEG